MLVRKNKDLKVNKQKICYDRRARAANYNVGDLVLVLDTTKKKGENSKFKRRWKGPFTIINQINQVYYITN